MRYKYPNRHPLSPSNRGDNEIITAITMGVTISTSRTEEKGGCFLTAESIKIPVYCYVFPVNVDVINKGVYYLTDCHGVPVIQYAADGIYNSL